VTLETPTGEVDLSAIAHLPSVTVEPTDLDVVELVQLGLVGPRLRLSSHGLALFGRSPAVVVRDVEATPLLLARAGAGTIATTALRPVAPAGPEDAGPAEGGTDLAGVVRGLPTAGDLARVDALTAPRTRVAWLVLASRTRGGRQLLAQLGEVVGARAHGQHHVVRVPWPAPGERGLFERPDLPLASRLASAHGAGHHVVVGDHDAAAVARKDRGGTVVFFTGLSGSGKSTIAKALHDTLEQRTEREITLLDGDDVRRMLSAGLGFDTAGREANVRRVSWVASLLARHGGIAITALIAPFAAGRAEARRMASQGADFVEVWVTTPLAECERRDRKGLYAQARAGKIPNFTGIDSPYEEPVDADLVLDTLRLDVSEAVEVVIAELEARAARRGEDFPARPLAPEIRTEVVGYDI
jgi:adenylyl-sulfate kinase